eukprot:gene7882-9701_t
MYRNNSNNNFNYNNNLIKSIVDKKKNNYNYHDKEFLPVNFQLRVLRCLYYLDKTCERIYEDPLHFLFSYLFEESYNTDFTCSKITREIIKKGHDIKLNYSLVSRRWYRWLTQEYCCRLALFPELVTYFNKPHPEISIQDIGSYLTLCYDVEDIDEDSVSLENIDAIESVEMDTTYYPFDVDLYGVEDYFENYIRIWKTRALKNEEEVCYLSKMLTVNSSIRGISISDNGIRSSKQLSESLMINYSVKELAINGNLFTGDDLFRTLLSTDRLQNIVISPNMSTSAKNYFKHSKSLIRKNIVDNSNGIDHFIWNQFLIEKWII